MKVLTRLAIVTPPTNCVCVCVLCVSLSAAIGADLVDPYLFTTHLTRVLIRWQENEGFRLPDGVGPLQGKFIIIFFFLNKILRTVIFLKEI